MVPWLIGIATISSGIVSMHGSILYDYKIGPGCISLNPLIFNILYIIINGLMQPVIMLVFVLLTFRNVHQSRQRAVSPLIPFRNRKGATTMANTNRPRKQFIIMIFTQVIATAFISVQWIIVYAYNTITTDDVRTSEQWSIIAFCISLAYYFYFLNNVKSFYVSILTSRLLQQTFIKALIRLLPRQRRQRWEAAQVGTATNDQQHRTLPV
jgi:hypothetical protein